jgi:hypothetical protein
LIFLGYHFSPDGLAVVEKTIEKFLARAVRLYEQEQGEPFGYPRLGLYVRRWVGWLTAGSLIIIAAGFLNYYHRRLAAESTLTHGRRYGTA